ncbi:MAG: hypothetical protein ACOC0R_02670 [Mariniphaga sp.]
MTTIFQPGCPFGDSIGVANDNLPRVRTSLSGRNLTSMHSAIKTC